MNHKSYLHKTIQGIPIALGTVANFLLWKQKIAFSNYLEKYLLNGTIFTFLYISNTKHSVNI